MRSPALRCLRSWGLAGLLLGLSACGARTDLPGGFPCLHEGETLACKNLCGEGVSTCTEGYWSACEVAPTVLSCEGDCGTGRQTCEEGKLGSCVVPQASRACSTKCGTGVELCENEAWSSCSAPQPLAPALAVTLRDFHQSFPDMERSFSGMDPGIAAEQLGSDGKPVYGFGTGTSLSTSGKTNFDMWYRDVSGVNQRKDTTIQLKSNGKDFYTFSDLDFFPLDNELFGNEGNPHNYHFTLEAEASFVYQGGEVFRFTGDDDVFVFINGHRIIDLGGLHEAASAQVKLDDVASKLGISTGQTVPFKLFFAERKMVSSTFLLETSIADLGQCP